MNNSQGWISLHRKICENDLWFLEPFTKAQAWIDLVLNTNHKDGVMNIRGNVIPIKRGQIGWSQITMTKRWKWSRQKVRRFLEYLISNEMIQIDNSEITPRQTQKTIQQKSGMKSKYLTSITTIINYNSYQSGQETIQQTIQQKDNRRYTNNNVNNVNKEYICSFETFWKQYPKKVAKKKAETIFKRLATSKKKEQEIMKGLGEYIKKWRTEKTDTKFIPNPITWLNQGRWEDDVVISNEPYKKNSREHEEKWKDIKRKERESYYADDGNGGLVKLSELIK